MCGVAGFWSYSAEWSKAKAERTLQRMTASIIHRGPDGSGLWYEDKCGVGFGHRRLSVQDISSAGAQPMISGNKRFTITYNGEIYNAQELRRQLDQSDNAYSWRGTSDTEVLLQACSTWGISEALKRSRGMFALAIWDNQEKVLYLARDRFGEKPLFYSNQKGSVVFGSELKVLGCHPASPRVIDPDAIVLYLRYGYIPAPRSIFSGVRKVLPGEIRIFRRGDGCFSDATQRYWRPDEDLYGERVAGQSSFRSVEDAAEALLPILTEAVQRQLVADVPLGAFLSGGIDSSLLVALMQQLQSQPTKTFTIGFEDKSYDEAPYARAVARHLGTEHHEQYVGPKQVFDVIPTMPEIYDEPLGDTSQIPTTLLTASARRHVTVCLSGDGGDELFGGYNHYRWGPSLINLLHAAPPSIALKFAKLANFTGLALKNFRLLRLSEMASANPPADPSRLLNAAIPNVGRLLSNKRNWSDVLGRPHYASHLDMPSQLMAFDLYGYLPDDILVKVDRASMASSLEVRAPYLDVEAAQFAWTLPTSLRSGNFKGKVLLRTLLARFIPQALVDRRKHGFGLPIGQWLRTDLKSWAEDKISHRLRRYDHWLNMEGIRGIWSEHQSLRANRQRELWVIISLLAWLDHNS